MRDCRKRAVGKNPSARKFEKPPRFNNRPFLYFSSCTISTFQVFQMLGQREMRRDLPGNHFRPLQETKFGPQRLLPHFEIVPRKKFGRSESGFFADVDGKVQKDLQNKVVENFYGKRKFQFWFPFQKETRGG